MQGRRGLTTVPQEDDRLISKGPRAGAKGSSTLYHSLLTCMSGFISAYQRAKVSRLDSQLFFPSTQASKRWPRIDVSTAALIYWHCLRRCLRRNSITILPYFDWTVAVSSDASAETGQQQQMTTCSQITHQFNEKTTCRSPGDQHLFSLRSRMTL